MVIDFTDIMDNRMVTNGEKMTEFIHKKVREIWRNGLLIENRK